MATHSKDFTENPSKVTSGSWVSHLCPHYKMRKPLFDFMRLTWAAPTDDTIFFTQTSCGLTLNSREACAVESAAHHHPHRPILLLMTSPTVNHIHPLMKVLLQLDNVQLSWLDLDQLFSEEPLWTWHQNRIWMYTAGNPSVTMSDAARSELLRRYGGTYMDLDAITLRPLPSTTNWLGRITDDVITGAVMSFSPGHRLFQEVVAGIPSAFKPESDISIGPEVIAQILHELCPDVVPISTPVDPDQVDVCGDIAIWPRRLLYPIPPGPTQEQLKITFKEGQGLGPAFFNNTDAYSLHLYNHVTKNAYVNLSGDSILKEAATRNCPLVVNVVRNYTDYM